MVNFDQKAVEAFFARHSKVCLEFSGGKDSLACLWLLQPWWGQLTVLWINMGDAYPETLIQMKAISKLVPNFVALRGDSRKWALDHGYPVDITPFALTPMGLTVTRIESEVRVAPFERCCNDNYWQLAHQFKTQGNYTGIIRGQKKADSLQAPITSGTIQDGVEYLLPVEDWTDEEVLAMVGDSLPDSYRRGIPRGLDCMRCTAYVGESQERLADLKVNFPEAYKEIRAVHKALGKAVEADLMVLKELNHGWD